jgi:NADPH:quinone reductase-like Zn-dependent oxidoreductase
VKAVVHDRYGPNDVLRLEDIERPVPKEDEVLVKVHATTVTRSDCGWRSASPVISRFFTGLRGPKRRILGTEFAGVREVGDAVMEFRIVDPVFGASIQALMRSTCASSLFIPPDARPHRRNSKTDPVTWSRRLTSC